MRKKINNFFATAIMFAMIACSTITCAYAAMSVPVQVNCDKDIILQDSDTFTISYYCMDDETEIVSSTEINAKKAGSISVNDGMYRIKSITYNGTNQTISESYGISGDFSAYSDLNETSTISLAIGSDACKELEGDYDLSAAAATYNVIMDANHDENGQPKDDYIPGLDDDIIPDESITATDQDQEVQSDQDLSQEDQEYLDQIIANETESSNTGSGEVVVEHYDEDDGEKNLGSSILIRLFPLGIAFIIAMLCVYIAHKKNII